MKKRDIEEEKQVGRWSALAYGLFYGYTHNISLQKQAEQKKIEAEYHRKELLIEQARLAYAKQNAASTTAVTTASGNELETSKKKIFFF